MQIEITRRRFLQGTVSLAVFGAGVAASTPLLASRDEKISNKIDPKLIKEIPTLCEMCVNKCAAIAHVYDKKVLKLNPNPNFPKSKNMLCPRGNAGIRALNDPDRIKFPLIRIGERGDGKYKQATWSEAFEYITKKTSKILDEEQDNRSTFCFAAGEGMGEHLFKNFYQMFGSANWLNHSSICLQTTVAAHTMTIGGYGVADLQNAKYIIMAGANRAESIVTPDTMDLFKRTKGRGAKLIVVDPRFTNTAAKSDKWLPINVGTDLAFVLALTYVVLSEELYDKVFVEANFKDFEEYKNHILSNNYTPDWAYEITGIHPLEIKQIARDFMQNAPQSIYYQGRRSTFSKNDFQLRRATILFSALGGGIDTKGGICFGEKLPLESHDVISPMYFQANSRAVVSKPNRKEGESEFQDFAINAESGSWISWRNMVVENKSPYPIRGMFIYKHNPMMSVPNSSKTKKMFEKMDLVVTIDTMPSDTAIMSDVILPECTYLERTDLVASFGGIEPSIAQRNKVVEPMYESKPLIEILRGLGEHLSKPLFEVSKKHDIDLQSSIASGIEAKIFEEYDLSKPFKQSIEEINTHLVSAYDGAAQTLKTKGVYYPQMDGCLLRKSINECEYYPEELKKYSVKSKNFDTPSGKIECKLDFMTQKGVDAMPTWKKDYELKIPSNKFVLLTGRHAQFTQSSTSNNELLLDLMPTNYLWINKSIAKQMGIVFGDEVEVKSSVGLLTIRAYPTEKIGPKNLFMIHGFGSNSSGLRNAYENGGNDNFIIEDAMEPVYGSAAMHETIVSVRRI